MALKREINSWQDKTNTDPASDELLCRYCRNLIPAGATVCHHCGRHQNIFLQNLRAEWIGIIISVIMMVIALIQLQSARTERDAAEKALNEAHAALETVQAVQTKTIELEKEATLQLLRAKKFTAEMFLVTFEEKHNDLNIKMIKPPSWGGPRDANERHQLTEEIWKLEGQIHFMRQDIEKWEKMLQEAEAGQHDELPNKTED